MSESRILTHKGYSIRKDAITEAEAKKLVEDLTVTPKVNQKYITPQAKAELTFKLYKESASRWYLPRAYGVQTFGPWERSVVGEGADLSDHAAAFGGTPYPYQTAIIDSFINAGANGLICVPCGKGKTFMALRVASQLKKRFLVIVDKEFLMNQWKGEMGALMPGLRVGILQGPRREVGPEYDCTICMIQSISGKDIPDGLFKDFGFVIFDECHHLGAQHFSKTLQTVQLKYMLGLSATPTREDGLTKVFFWFLGEPVYWEKKREPDPTVIVKSVRIEVEDAAYTDIPVNWRGEPIMARLLGNVLGCEARTVEILRWIRLLAAEPARKILVLSERIGHLQEIEAGLVGDSLAIAYYIGGMKEAEREGGAATARILLASYAMASEAMNIKSLNTVVLASPRKHVEQSTGRILRTRVSERTVVPIIVDIVDSHSMYMSQWKKRHSYYKQCAYNVETWPMGASEPSKVTRAAAAAVPVYEEAGCLID